MAGADFTASIVGNVTGFDVSPINNLSNSLKQVPASATGATSATTNFTGAVGRVASGASSAVSPISTLGTTTRTAGSTFTASGALANNFGNSILTAGRSTTTFTGGLNSMNTGLTGVQGGLTSANTLTGTLGTTSQQTAAKQGTLTSQIGLAATSFAGLTATGVELFNMYDALGDAQFNVTRATAALGRIQNSEAATQIQINKLAKEGKTGTDEYGLAVSRLAVLHQREEVAKNNVANAQEDLNKTYAAFVGQLIPTIIQGVSSSVALFTALRPAGLAAQAGEEAAAAGAAALKTEQEAAGAATLALNLRMVALAAPLIAAAALFVLIETNTFGLGDAFRSITPIIGQGIDAIVNGAALIFNGIVQLGNAFVTFGALAVNAFTGIHDAFAAAFNGMINGIQTFAQDFQNGLKTIYNFFVDSVINPMINAWNAFNQGVAKAWQATVDTVNRIFGPVVENIAKGLKVVTDAFALLPGAAGDSFKKVSAQLQGVIDQFAKSGETGKKAGADINTGFVIPNIPKAQIATTDFNTEFIKLVGSYQNVNAASHTFDGALIQNAGNLHVGAQAALDWASHGENLAGVVKSNVVPAFGKLLGSITDGTKGIVNMIFPTDALADTTTKGASATLKGADATSKATEAHAKLATQLTDTIAKQNAESEAQLKSIASGQQYAKVLADLNKAFADVSVKLADNVIKLTDATAIQQRHSIAVQDGINKALEFGIKLQDDATSTKSYNQALDQATGFSQKFGDILPATTSNLETLAKAMSGDADAADKFLKSFVDASNGVGTASQQLVDDVGKAFEDVGTRTNDALSKIPAQVSRYLSPEALDLIGLKGEWQAATKLLTEGIASEFQAGGQQFSAAGLQAVRSFIVGFSHEHVTDAPEIQDFLSSFEGVLNKASGQGAVAGKQTIAQFLLGVEQGGGGPAAAARAIAENMGLTDEVASLAAKSGSAAGGAFVNGVQTGTSGVSEAFRQNVIVPINSAPTPAQQSAAKVAAAFQQLGTAFDALPAYFLKIFTEAFVDNLLTPLAAGAAAIRGWITGVQGLVNAGIPPLFTKSFNTAVQNAAGSLNQISSYAKGPWLSAMEGAVRAFVSFANSQFASIKPPATPTAGPTTPVGPTAPIRIPAPDLTLFEAGLAKMQTDANNAFIAIVNLAKTQTQGIAVAFTQAFNTAAQNAAGSLNQLQTFTTGALGRIAGLAQTVAVTWTQSFNTATQNAAGTMNQLQSFATGSLGRIAGLAQTVAVTWTQQFNVAVQNAAGSMNQLAVTAQTDIANIIAAVSAVAIAFTTGFNTAAQNAAGSVNQLAVTVETDIQNMIDASNALAVAFTTNFNKGAQNAAGSINQLAVNVEQNIANMSAATLAFAVAITSNYNKGAQNAAGIMNDLSRNVQGNIANQIAATNAFAIAITSNFSKGAQNAAGSMNALTSNVNTNVNNMNNKLSQVTGEFNNITSSINRAKSAVDALKNDINSIPTSKTVTVNVIEHRTIVTDVITRPILLNAGTTTTAAQAGLTTTAGLASGIPRKITVEVKEPTNIVIDGRIIAKIINRKILELDAGAIA